jgi:polyphosphate kinase
MRLRIFAGRSFEDAGVQVFYGLVGLKTHAKLAPVVREDLDGTIRRYAHLGTGNYNPLTARYYTDFSLLTCDEAITASVNDVFNFLTAYAEQPNYKPLLVAPRDLAKGCIALIDREARNAKRWRPARIIAKMNALVDPPVIQALCRASQAGVEIDLIVRGQCALLPGLRGVSSRIRVRGIAGRFLEHSRIFCFGNAGQPEIYLGSADERVEVLFPLKDPQLRLRITEEILPAYLADTRAARLLGADGNFRRSRADRNGHGISVQEQLMGTAQHSPSAFDTRMGKIKRKIHGAVYTDSAGSAAPDDPTAESASQDSLNASV